MLAKALASASASAPKVYIEDVFSTWLYTGNGSTQTITNGIDLSGEGGLVWVKSRSLGTSHVLTDTTRGSSSQLYSDRTNAQGTVSDQVTAFTGSGFSLGTDTLGIGTVNASAATYASWTFRKAAKFFDVVTYTGNGSNRTIAHSLGSVPGTIIVKRTDTTANWQVYHRSLANTEYLVLNSTAAKATGTTRWNSTTPTSTEFSLGTDTTVNANGGTYVAYLFAHDAGGFGDSGNESVVKCGTFTCDGSGNVGTVDLGWEPQWILTKRTDSTQNWYQWDSMREWALTSSSTLSPNISDAEVAMAGTSYLYPTATGFAGSSNFFGPNAQVIYIAIRRGPIKTPTDATKVFAQVARTGTGAAANITGTGFAPDAMIYKSRSNAVAPSWQTRLQGGSPRLSSASTAAESADNELDFGLTMDGIRVLTGDGVINFSSWTYINYFLRRAPGFFDVVAYTGTGVARTVAHNLGVAPELMIVKKRSAIDPWYVYANNDNTDYLVLNTDAATVDQITVWNDTSPTSSVFTVGTNDDVNGNTATFIAYLFATLSGVSKVGSYTGTGTTLSVDCGFTNGARFVLIKRTDSTGDWYVWDTARGIVSGNDPYLLLNSTAAEDTATDYIDPLSSGFQISSTAPAAINANGGNFIFLAIA